MDEIILSLVEAVARLNERLNEQQDVVRVPGKDGRPPTEAEIKAAVDKWMADNAEAIKGKDGDSVTAKMVEAVAVEWLAKNIVQPKDGDSAKDPTAEQIQTAVDLWAEFNRDSFLPTDEQVANAAEAWLAKNIKQPKNGADAKPVTKEQIEAVAHEWLNANRASLKGDTTKPDEPVGIALIEQRDGRSFWITLDDGREYQIDLPEPAKFFGGGGGLSKARADELYAPIGSGGGDGKSAYEIAVDEGFSGDESAWLASLKGEVGPQGEQGIQGEQGDAGENAALSDATPQALGTAAAGTSGEGSRADHKHSMPTAAQVGADPAGTAAAGDAAHLAASDPHPQYPLAKFFNSSGEISAQVKIWTGTVTSDGNGDFTVDYSSAGFTSPPMVTVSALSTNTDTVRDKEWATLRETPTTTSANGYTLRGNLIIAILIGGAETIRDAGNVVVHVQAIGV